MSISNVFSKNPFIAPGYHGNTATKGEASLNISSSCLQSLLFALLICYVSTMCTAVMPPKTSLTVKK